MARFSQIWLDPEREEMSAVGMGAVYERTSDGRPLRESWTEDARKEVLGRYATYHENLQRVAIYVSKRHGVCVIVDLPNRRPPGESASIGCLPEALHQLAKQTC